MQSHLEELTLGRDADVSRHVNSHRCREPQCGLDSEVNSMHVQGES